jgi:hypothetical protein
MPLQRQATQIVIEETGGRDVTKCDVSMARPVYQVGKLCTGSPAMVEQPLCEFAVVYLYCKSVVTTLIKSQPWCAISNTRGMF